VGYQVTFAAQADRDLGSVVRFLAQKNPAAAEKLGYALIDETRSLANLPNRGMAVRKRPEYRRILHRPWFLIYYRVDEARQLVEVARIWDARQNRTHFVSRLSQGCHGLWFCLSFAVSACFLFPVAKD
jgi:plasmid stabilization system protein ParE